MKSKLKILPVLLIACLCCLLTACDRFYKWEVAQGVKNISSIEIVEIITESDYTILCEIKPENYEELVKEVQSMDLYKYSGEPHNLSGKAFKISFKDGSYDLIAVREPRHYIKEQDGYIYSEYSWRFFQKDQFDQLIEKWIANS